MKKRLNKTFVYRYTIFDELLASPSQPMPEDKRRHQLTRMNGGLHAMMTAPEPTADDWRVVSDAVNLMETLVSMGVAEDVSGLLQDAVKALAIAGHRHTELGQHIRLDADGIAAVRSVLEDYAEMLNFLPHRTMLRCHRLTERRILEIQTGKSKAHDVTITSL